jgi:hypothetical protein
MMELVVYWYLAMCAVMSIIAVQEDHLHKKIAQGYNPNARDGDKDGLVQEGTRWERKIKK